MSLPESSKPAFQSRPAPRVGDTGPAPMNGEPFQAPVYRQPAILSAGPTVGGLLSSLWRRLPLALAIATLLGGLAGTILWFAVPAKYVADAGIEVRRPPREVFQSWEQLGEPLTYLRTQAQLMKSPLILGAALKNPQAAELAGVRQHGDTGAAVAWLDKMVAVTFKAGSDVLNLSVTADDPREAATLANAIVDAYVEEHRARRNDYLQKLKGQYTKGEDTMKRLRGLLGNFENPKLLALETNWQTAQLNLKSVEAELKIVEQYAKSIPTMPVSDAAVEEYVRRDPVYEARLKELLIKEEEKTRTAQVATYGDRDPRVRGMQAQVEALKRGLDDRRRSMMPVVESLAREKAATDNQIKIRDLQGKIAAYTELEKHLADECRKQGVGITERPEQKALRDQMTSILEVQNKVNQEVQIVEMEGRHPTWVVPLGRTEPPQEKDRSKQLRAAGMGAGGLFALGLFSVAFLEFRARRVSAPSEIAQGLGIRLVGTVPSLPARARRTAVTGSSSPRDVAWQGRLTESIDAIRTMLLRAAGDGPRIVMITSATSGEGKTSLAGQLAVSLARAWRKTLLIDGDVRKPAAHVLFGLQPEPGLCEVLRGELEANDVVQSTPVSRLWLMPAGHWDAHAIQALAQEGSGALFETLKEQYDFVVVDSSPVLPVADALVLGQHVDAVLLAVRTGTSRLPTVNAANYRLHSIGVPVLGAVVIGANNELGELSYPRSAGS